MTDTPARNTKLSLIALSVLGTIAAVAIAYEIDTWVAGGAMIRKVAQTCNVVSTGCSTAYSSILRIVGSPQQIILTLALAALALAIVKAAIVLVTSRKVTARYRATASGEFPVISAILAKLGAEDITVRVADSADLSAFTCGVIKPAVCLSRGIVERLGEDELAALIAHEVAHVHRRDNLAIFIARFVRDFLWPLPVSHHLFSIFIGEKEYAADDFAVAMTGQPIDLAGAIVSVAKARASQRGRVPSPAYATFFADAATAKARVHRLVGSTERMKPSVGKLLVSALVSAAILASAVGLAYAQPLAKLDVSAKCKMGGECASKNYSCCRSK